MTPEVEARFRMMEERFITMQERMIEIEDAQLHMTKALTKLSESGADNDERIKNLTILVDRLVARDLEQ